MLNHFFLAGVMVFSVPCVFAASANQHEPALHVKEIAVFNDVPWGVAFVSPSSILVTLKQGKLVLVDVTSGQKMGVSGAPRVDSAGQGGLLDVEVAPDFEQSHWVYFTYSKPTENGATTALGRGKLIGTDLVDWQTLFIAKADSDKSIHYGSRITFDNDGHLFFSVGERGHRANAQDLTNHAGSILRLNLDGSVPSDNPYIRSAKVQNAIWSYGHRNPQGLYFDTETNQLWASEHGPRGGDEINLIRAGGNYGWPIVSYGKEYRTEVSVGEGERANGVTDPKKVYVPSIAPSDLLRYQGDLFPEWKGDFLSTALALRHLNKFDPRKSSDQNEKRYLQALNERMRSITEAPDGSLILSTDSGRILQITPAD